MKEKDYSDALDEAEKFTESKAFSYFNKSFIAKAKGKFNTCLKIAKELKDAAKIREMEGRLRFLNSCI